MSDDAAHSVDLPPPSGSGRLLSLVRKLIGYGMQVAASLRQRTTPSDTTELARRFGTADLVVIAHRIALGLRRAVFLQERITHTAATIDAGPQPEPAPSRRNPRAPNADLPRPARLTRPEPQPTDTASVISRLPTISQIAAKVRRQPIGAVLADICRDLGIRRDHPLWDELHAAITEFGGSFIRLFRDKLNQACPIAHIVARFKAEAETEPEPAGTGPPSAIAA